MSMQGQGSAAVRNAVLAAALGAIAGQATVSAQDNIAERGRAVYEEACAPCHARGPGSDGAAMLPGPAALMIKYRGSLSPYLEERDDLNAEVLKLFVRNGTGSMPRFRKTEVSDADVEAIAAYIASDLGEDE
jgi:mono/diheme cytochrome c family protein